MTVKFGIASYISVQNRRLAETPAYEPGDEEMEPNNPSFLAFQHEYAVKIRLEDFPSESDASEMLTIFFEHCHPYLPIVNKASFMQQWESSNREQISPLLLEAIFACGGRLMTDPSIGLRWIARASSKLFHRPDVMIGNISTNRPCRTCRLFHGCTTVEYCSSASDPAESSGIGTPKGVLLPVMDRRGDHHHDGPRLGIRDSSRAAPARPTMRS